MAQLVQSTDLVKRQADIYAMSWNINEYQRKGRVTLMKFKPLGDRVLVQRDDDADQKSAGGIIIPDSAKEKPQRGTIVSTGPGNLGDDGKRTPLEVKKGDSVLFGKYSGTEIKLDGDEFLIMHENDILGIVG